MKRWVVPEVLQTSMMDCGPAALKAVLEGFGRAINFERLRERCQTDVDGTSMTALSDTADRLGLDVAQIMVPKDNLLLPGADTMPAIIFLVNPDGLLHFVVIWSVVGSFVQVMDPGRGRLWMRHQALLDKVATPTLNIPAARWRAWASGADFQQPLHLKLQKLGAKDQHIASLVARAAADPTPAAFAALDAATRFVGRLVAERAIPRGPSATKLLESLFISESVATPEQRKISAPFWICTPGPGGKVASTGAVLLRFEGEKEEPEQEEEKEAPSQGVPRSSAVPDLSGEAGIQAERTKIMANAPHRPAGARATSARRPNATRLSMVGVAAPGQYASVVAGPPSADAARQSMWAGPVLAPAVKAELSATTVRPMRIFVQMMWAESRGSVLVIALLLVVGVATGVLDAMMMRGLASTLDSLALPVQRIGSILAVALFLVLAFGADLVQTALLQRLARGLEARLRVAFLEKLPRLEDRYFRSRPISDMASRAHLLQTLRGVPSFLTGLFASVLNICLTAGVLVWLEPRLKWLVLGMVVVTLLLPVLSYRLLDESLARLRTHGGALSRFYLDALLGVLPIRVHGAERAVRREHEGLLTEWVRTGRQVEVTSLGVFALEGYLSTVVTVVLVGSFVARGGDLRALLLLALFAQRLPGYAEGLVRTVRKYPVLKHDALRLFEPLSAAETDVPLVRRSRAAGPRNGVNLVFRGVHAVAGGRDVLKGINLEIRAGKHVAIVGPSGAGKSSLVSVLLGWLFVSEGRVLIDGRPLDALQLAGLREDTAWVDPAIQIWNQSLFENLMYGHDDRALSNIEEVLDSADLVDAVERMPDGLQSSLGEGGGRISGGQGQRVRLGRAMLKRDARLVIFDEPFRGLERDKRRALLAEARRIWAKATILYVSHDVGDTLGMDEVFLVDDGRIAERGTPAELVAGQTAYRAMVEADQSALAEVWGRPEWRRMRMEGSELVEERKAK